MPGIWRRGSSDWSPKPSCRERPVTTAVLRKELVSLWVSALPYVAGAAFHLVLGVLAVNQLEVRGQAVFQPLVPVAGFLLLFTMPVLTMRSFAEEARSGSLDLLLAAPAPARPLVVGKWLAAWLSGLVLLAPAGLFVVLLQLWGDPDPGPVVAGVTGLALLAAALAGIGVLASSLTSSQPVAAMAGVFAILVLWFAHTGADALGTGGTLAAVSLSERLRTFAGGAVDTADVAYLTALTAGSLVAAAVAVELRRVTPVGRLLRLAGVGLVVVVLGVRLSGRHDLYDLTAERSVTLSAQSLAVLEDVGDDVEITAFLRRDEPGRVEAAALLDRYRKDNRRVDWRVLDPDESPGEVARLGVDPVFGGLAVESGGEVALAPAATEQDVTAALARLVRDRDAEVCLSTGHGEPSLLGAAELLEGDGFAVRIVDLLAVPTPPPSCTAIVLAGPTAPLGAAEDALARWTAADGKLLVLADPVAELDLDAVLGPFGLGLDRGIVFEGDERSVIGGDVTAPIVRTYSSGNPIVRRLAPTYFPGVQGVVVDEAAEGEVAGLVLSRLADTSPASYLETEPIEAVFDPAEDTPGPITVAASADRPRNTGAAIERTRVVVVGDVDFATDRFLAEAGNADLLLRAVGWLTLGEDLLTLSANLPAERPLRLTDGRLAYARLLTAGMVPGVFLLVGAMVWAARRRR